MKRKNLIILTVLFIVIFIQFFRINQTNPIVDEAQDFIMIEKPTAEVSAILKNACYDCHSYKSKYPWYANVAPISWMIGQHISSGRKHLNFSVWGEYSSKKQLHKLEEITEEINEGKMPIPIYTWMHHEAKHNEEDRKEIVDWILNIK